MAAIIKVVLAKSDGKMLSDLVLVGESLSMYGLSQNCVPVSRTNFNEMHASH